MSSSDPKKVRRTLRQVLGDPPRQGGALAVSWTDEPEACANQQYVGVSYFTNESEKSFELSRKCCSRSIIDDDSETAERPSKESFTDKFVDVIFARAASFVSRVIEKIESRCRGEICVEQ